MTRAILIYVIPQGFAVHEGEQHSGPLSWDELVGQIAAMTMPERASLSGTLFGMHTPEEWDGQRARGRRTWAPHNGDLSEPARKAVYDLAREFGVRGGDFDELLPADSQLDPRVHHAMKLLEACKAGRQGDAS